MRYMAQFLIGCGIGSSVFRDNIFATVMLIGAFVCVAAIRSRP